MLLFPSRLSQDAVQLVPRGVANLVHHPQAPNQWHGCESVKHGFQAFLVVPLLQERDSGVVQVDSGTVFKVHPCKSINEHETSSAKTH